MTRSPLIHATADQSCRLVECTSRNVVATFSKQFGMSTEQIDELFDIFLADPGVLPDEWRRAAEEAGSQALRARIVADYIAGMTDRFALEEHRVLTDPFARA